MKKKKTNKQIYEEIKSSIDIPVYDVCYRDLFKIMKKNGEDFDKDDYYYNEYDGRSSGFYNYKSKYIFIYKYYPLTEKIWMLLHEKKHRDCHKYKCPCWTQRDEEKQDFEREYCAISYSIDECKRNKYLDSLYSLYKQMLVGSLHNDAYGKVYRIFLENGEWFDIIDILKEHKYDLQIPVKSRFVDICNIKRRYKIVMNIEEY